MQTGVMATALSQEYNIFQFHHEGLFNLYDAVRDMTIEACEYYGIDFKAQKYYLQAVSYTHLTLPTIYSV